MGIRGAVVAWCAWLALLCGGRVRAQSFTLELHAPESSDCIDAAALMQRVEARVGSVAGGAPVMRFAVVIAPLADGHRALVTASSASATGGGQRELVAQGACSALDEMLVLAIASSLGVMTLPPEVADVREPPPPPDQPRSLPRRTPAWQLDASVGGRLLTGVAAETALGPGLAVLAQWEGLGVRIGGSWLPETVGRTASALELRTGGALGELGLCGCALRGPRLSVLFCAEVWGGALRATASSLWQPTARWDGLLLLAPRVAAQLQLTPRAGLGLGLGSAIPLLFPRYTYGSAAGERVVAQRVELGVFVELALWLRIHP